MIWVHDQKAKLTLSKKIDNLSPQFENHRVALSDKPEKQKRDEAIPSLIRHHSSARQIGHAFEEEKYTGKRFICIIFPLLA